MLGSRLGRALLPVAGLAGAHTSMRFGIIFSLGLRRNLSLNVGKSVAEWECLGNARVQRWVGFAAA